MKIDFFGTENDQSKQKNSNIEEDNNQFGDANLFDNEFADLENEFQEDKLANPFGKSTTKELLAQSRKQIEEDDDLEDEIDPPGGKKMKSLAIEIDEYVDYEEQNNLANEQLNQNL